VLCLKRAAPPPPCLCAYSLSHKTTQARHPCCMPRPAPAHLVPIGVCQYHHLHRCLARGVEAEQRREHAVAGGKHLILFMGVASVQRLTTNAWVQARRQRGWDGGGVRGRRQRRPTCRACSSAAGQLKATRP
jgi:hypothetical protein